MKQETTPPGRLLLSTPVYGDRSFVNAILSDGSLGIIRHECHLEIRKVTQDIRVFDITVSHRPDAESKVVGAKDQGSFSTIGEAATFATDFTSSYREAAEDDFAERRSIALRQNAQLGLT
jgi:hypothetical protein